MSRINRVLVLFGALLILSSSAMAFLDHPMQVRLHSLAGGSATGFATHHWNDSNHTLGTNNFDLGFTMGWYGEIPLYADIATISFAPDGEGGSGMGFMLNKDEQSFGNYLVAFQRGEAGSRQGSEWNHLTLGYGYALEGANVGIIFNRQNTSETNGDVEMSEGWNMIGAGIDYELNEDTNVDASFRFTTGTDKMEGAGDSDYDESGSGFGFGARAFYDWREDVTVVPVFTFQSAEYVEEFKQSFIGIGAAFAYNVNEDNDVVFGLNFQSYTEEWTGGDDGFRQANYEHSTTVLPGFYLGVEHEFTDWLTVRSAATKEWTKFDNGESGDALVEDSYFPFGFSLGAGIAMGDWQIDMGLNTEWLYHLGYWFHGADASSAPVASLQAKLFF